MRDGYCISPTQVIKHRANWWFWPICSVKNGAWLRNQSERSHLSKTPLYGEIFSEETYMRRLSFFCSLFWRFVLGVVIGGWVWKMKQDPWIQMGFWQWKWWKNCGKFDYLRAGLRERLGDVKVPQIVLFYSSRMKGRALFIFGPAGMHVPTEENFMETTRQMEPVPCFGPNKENEGLTHGGREVKSAHIHLFQ